MRRRYGIPFTFLLMFASLYASQWTPFSVYYLLVAVSAAWAAYDSKQINAADYDSAMAMPPLGVAIALLILWPITFPWYLKLRWRVLHGDIRKKPESSGILAKLIVGVLVLFIIIGAAGVYLVMKAPKLWSTMMVGLSTSAEFKEKVSMSLKSGNKVEISLNASKVPLDSASRARFARSVADYVYARYPQAPGDSLRALTVVLEDKTEAGPLAVTRGANRFTWTAAQLRGAPGAERPVLANANTGGNAGANAPAQPGVTTKTVAAAATKTSPPMKPASTAQANVTPAGAPTAPVRTPAAFQRFASADPGTTWSKLRSVIGDVDCDNVADTVAVGLNKQEVHVAVARAADPEPQILVFDLGGSGGVSSPKIALESLDFDPAARGLSGVEGLRRSRTCKGVMLGDRERDPVHLVWSSKTQHIEWYRVPRQTPKPR